jgi:mRNA-degrading endonuclease toxin of MazEF toxin-antitoxin module
MIQPGDIFWSSERAPYPRHRLIVVSIEPLNRGGYVVAVPLTSQRLPERFNRPNYVYFERGEFGLRTDCVVQAEAVAQIDKDEIDTEHGYFGHLDEASLHRVKVAIAFVIGLST